MQQPASRTGERPQAEGLVEHLNRGKPDEATTGAKSQSGIELDAENAARRTGRRLEDTAVAAAEIHEPVGRTDSQRLEHRGDPPGRQPAPRSQHRGQTKTGNGGETRNNEARRREARNRGGQGSGRPARGQHKPNASARTSQTEPARSSGRNPARIEFANTPMITEPPGHPGHSPVLVGWIQRKTAREKPEWVATCERCGRQVSHATRRNDAEAELRRHRTACRPRVEVVQRHTPWWPGARP